MEPPPPPGECDYCGIDFGDAETLADHENLHLNRPMFQCLECERLFPSRNSLKRHMRAHVRAK